MNLDVWYALTELGLEEFKKSYYGKEHEYLCEEVEKFLSYSRRDMSQVLDPTTFYHLARFSKLRFENELSLNRLQNFVDVIKRDLKPLLAE